MVKYIHAADLHLDSPFKGLKNIPENLFDKIKDSTFESLKKIVDTAVSHDVDFVLLAGDIYDVEDRSIRAQVYLREELDRLNKAGIKVYLVHGNHDFVTSRELHLTLPENVEVFGPDVETRRLETRNNERVAISGFSYDRNWIEDRKIQEYPQRDASVDFHIGILHGFMEGQDSEHAKYAPFSITELKEKNYDYWALGHIHKRQELSRDPLILYSGNTQGRHKNEPGEKGCLLVELTKTGEDVTFVSTAEIKWVSLNLDVTACESLNDVFDHVKSELGKEEHENCLISLTLEVSVETPSSVIRKLEDEAFYQVFQRTDTLSFTYIVSYAVKYRRADEQMLSLESSFPSAWEKAIKDVNEDDAFRMLTQELFGMHAYAKFTDAKHENYKNDIISAAENLLIQDLGDGISHDN